MRMNISVRIRIAVPTRRTVRKMMTDGLRRVIDALAKNMARQMRINTIRDGKPGGVWQKLSGFGEGAAAKRLARAEKRTFRGGKSRHRKYAKRKAEGKTPGGGKFGAGDRLRDTEALFKSFAGKVEETRDGYTIHAVAEGGSPGRPTNQRLLEIHSRGEGNMPVRDPTADMSHFERRAKEDLEAFVSKVPEFEVVQG